MSSEDETVSKAVQVVVTFGVGGTACYYMWPQLETVSRALVILFALLAAASINSGTWMQNSRNLRRQQRDERRQTYKEASEWLLGKPKNS